MSRTVTITHVLGDAATMTWPVPDEYDYLGERKYPATALDAIERACGFYAGEARADDVDLSCPHPETVIEHFEMYLADTPSGAELPLEQQLTAAALWNHGF